MGKKSVQNHKCVSMGESRGKTLVKRVISMVLILAMVFVSDAFYGLEIAKAEDEAVISIKFNELRGVSVKYDNDKKGYVLKEDDDGAESLDNIDFLNGNQSVSSNATNNVIYMDVKERLTLDVSCASGNWGAAITDVAGNALGTNGKLQVRNSEDSKPIWEETNEIGIGAIDGKLQIISGKKVQGPGSGLYLYVYNYGENDTVTATFKAKIQFYNPALDAKVIGDDFIVGKKSKSYTARVMQNSLESVKEGDYTTSLSTTDKFRWSVSDTTKATIGETTGILTAKDVENGSVDVIGQAWNGIEVSDSSQALMVTKKRNCRIQTDKPVAISKSVSAEKLSFKETSYEFAIGNEFVLYSNIVATPQNYTDDLVWTSSNTDVAVVKDGIVTAKKTGTTTITVQGDNQQVQATCTVRVYSTAQKLVTYLEENNTQSTYKALRDQNTVTVRVEELGKDGKGATEAIEASVTEPEYIQVTNVDTEENASKKYYEIKVLKPVATKKECTVVFQAKDSGVSASFRVEIFPSVPDTAQIKLERENATVETDTVDVYIGDQNPVVLSPILQDVQPNDQFDWKVTENAPLLNVTTKSSSVSLVGLARGTAKLVATARSNTKVSKTINIRVLQGASKVTLANQSVSLAKGSRTTLNCSFEPADTDEAVIWNSSDTSVATVDQKGRILGVEKGIATITATTEHTGLVASCVVTVTESSNMTLSNTTIIAVYDGKSQNITVTVKDAASGAVVSNPEVTWKSEDETIVTVEKKAAGAATLTFGKVGQTYVTVEYGESSRSVLVTVNSPITAASFKGLSGDSSNRTQFTYLPNGQKPEISVIATTDRDARGAGSLYTLEQGKDYAVTDSCGEKAQKGTYTYTLNGDQVCYTGSKTLHYQVMAKDISNALTDPEIGCTIDNQTYTGSQLKPDVFLSYTVGNETQTLVNGTDYSVTYTNNVNAGTATATITGRGNFTGSFQKEFTIYPYNLNGVIVTITKNPVYTGGEVFPTFSVKYNTKSVVVETDFEVEYSNNINAGSNAKLVMTAVADGNYTGTKSVRFTIEPKSITRVNANIAQQTYCGSALSPEVTVKEGEKVLVAGVDYTVTYADNINAGTAKATLTGMGNYNETKEITFRIAKADMKSVTIAPIPTQYYVGGSPVKPKLNLTIGETVLEEGVDYEATYENNISVGTATVTIKATASSLNLSGSTSAAFTIVQRENINYPADTMSVQSVSGASLIEDTIYVDTDAYSYYEIDITSGLGNCDDVAFASISSGETMIACGTSLINEGTRVLLAVKGLKPGNTTLYLETLGGRIRKTLNVTVYRPAESFHIYAKDSAGNKTQISGGAASIVANHSMQLEAEFTPSDSTDVVEWTVNRSDIATVNEDGVLTALNPGTVTITGTIKATVNNKRGKKVSGIVTVVENKPATSITLNKEKLSLKEGASEVLEASTLPENNTEQLVWKSSDEKVATVSQVGKVTAISQGEATITCSNFAGDISASCVVTVSTIVSIEQKSIAGTSVSSIEKQTYCGSALLPGVTVKDGKNVLVEGEDYTVSYENNVNAGTAKVILTGIGNYYETKEVTFQIATVDMKSVSIAPIPTQYYVGGSPVKPKLNVTIGETTLVEGVDYEAIYENNISVGDATVTINAMNTNLTGSTSANFKIVQRENINRPADAMVVNAVSGASLIGDTIYVDTDVYSYYEINISSSLGACDDVSFASIPAGETLISGGTSLIDEGTKVLLAVKGLKPGNTTLYLETLGGRVRKTLNVVVYRPASTFGFYAVDAAGNQLQISGGAASIIANHSMQLKAKFTPSDSTDLVEWSVNRPDIATVNENGLLTALNPGTVTVTGTIKATENNARGKTVSGIVTVIENKPATSITLNKAAISLKEGASETLRASSLPENNTEQLVWKSSDETIATVSQVGKVTAVSKGVATITCSNFEGNIFASCVVTVASPATSIALSEAEKTLKQGETFELMASLVPETAFEEIVWSISQEGIVSIENLTSEVSNLSKIKVTAVAPGKVTITATSVVSKRIAKCTVAIAANETGQEPQIVAQEVQVSKPEKTTIRAAKNTTKKTMQIMWKAVEGAEGYQVAYGLKANFKGAKKKNTKKTSISIKNLKKKKTYYVRVRAYKTVNGQKLYGDWSGKKKVKIRK